MNIFRVFWGPVRLFLMDFNWFQVMAGQAQPVFFFNSSYPFLIVKAIEWPGYFPVCWRRWIVGQLFFYGLEGWSPIDPVLLRMAFDSRIPHFPEHFRILSCLANSSKRMMPFSARFFPDGPFGWPDFNQLQHQPKEFPLLSLYFNPVQKQSIVFLNF